MAYRGCRYMLGTAWHILVIKATPHQQLPIQQVAPLLQYGGKASPPAVLAGEAAPVGGDAAALAGAGQPVGAGRGGVAWRGKSSSS